MSYLEMEIEKYKKLIGGFSVPLAASFLRNEYKLHRITKPAYEWLEMNLEDIV